MRVVFIAGPYIGDGNYEVIERNIREAEKYQIALANHQVGFFCSHCHTEHFSCGKATATEDFYFNLGMQFLGRIADAVLAVPGWEKSNGARYEIEWAKKKGLPVFYPKDPGDIREIVEWSRNKIRTSGVLGDTRCPRNNENA